MSLKPVLSVRSPRNLDAFVHGTNPDKSPVARPSAVIPSENLPPPPNKPVLVSSIDAEATDSAPSSPATADFHGRRTTSSGRRPKMRGVVRRADGDERARVTVYLGLDVAAKLRRHCFENGLELSDVAAEAINGFVAALPDAP
jgi:hypothetical protein